MKEKKVCTKCKEGYVLRLYPGHYVGMSENNPKHLNTYCEARCFTSDYMVYDVNKH
jgi:hypothetical protein